MKAGKGIIICTIIGVILQNLIFLYVEKVYLAGSNKYNIEKVESNSSAENLEIDIDNKAEDVRTSYNGRYISYMKDNKLEICDSKDGSKKEYKENSGKLVYYKWLTDCNKIISIEKTVENGDIYFVPISYDAKTGQVNEITDFNMNEVKIKSDNSGAKVDLIAFSTASSSLYIKIKEDNEKSNLYYADQMNNLQKVKSNVAIGNITVPTTSCDAVMELDNKISILNNRGEINVPNVSNPKILGSDKNDKVYFCNDNNGKTDVIYYSNLTENNYKWSKIKLKSQESITNIYVDYSGKIYINDSSEKKVKELTKSKEIKYQGEFQQTYSEGIISKKGNKVIKNKLS